MSLNIAVVKYGVNDTDAQKIRALKDGIIECALSLVEEFGVDADVVKDVIEEAVAEIDDLSWNPEAES